MVLAPVSLTAAKERAGRVIEIVPRLATHLPEPAVERRSDGERTGAIFLPIQRYARPLMGLPAREVTRSETLSALNGLAKADRFDGTLYEPLRNYLATIIRECPRPNKDIINAARKALVNLNRMNASGQSPYPLSP